MPCRVSSILWNHCQFPFGRSGAILDLIRNVKGIPVMTAIRSAEYRYFSFTYFMGKAYFGLAEQTGTRV